jgi:hypothetical protein
MDNELQAGMKFGSIAQKKGKERIPRSSSTAKKAPKRGSLTQKASKKIEEL